MIHLSSGSYPTLSDMRTRSGWITISGAGDPTPPVIAGADLLGSQYLRFTHVRFSDKIYISDSPFVHQAQPANHIQVLNSVITCPSIATSSATAGIVVRAGAQDVSLVGDYVHHCVVGFASVAQDTQSSRVTISHSTFEDFSGDAIDLGGMHNVMIDHDVIRDISDPAGVYHDDGIQFFGNVSGVRITNNVIANSRGQLIFIQDAIAGLHNHSSVNRNILVADNLIYGAGAWAIQSQGAVGVKFIGNTMWSNHFGSLLVRRSSFTRITPNDTIIVNNIIQGLGFDHASAALEEYNLLTSTYGLYRSGQHDLRNVDPAFVSPREGDFQLKASSPAIAAGATAAVLHNRKVRLPRGMTDVTGLLLPPRPNIGAVQRKDPPIGYGAPKYGPPPLF